MKRMSDMTRKYVGKTFGEYTCMNLLYNWYSDLGISVPDSFKDLNLHTYFKAWEKDKEKTTSTMLDLFNTLGEPADKIQKHDLLAVKDMKGNIYAAVSLGGKKILTSHIIEGVRVQFIGKNNEVILARRLL